MLALDQATLPCHIGIIMDGNGRWAQQRNLPRTEGHKQGLKTAKRIVLAVKEAGIGYLSLYTFSTENWKRTAEEVGFLMNLIPGSLRREIDFYRENSIKVIHSGNLAELPAAVQEAILETVEATAGNTSLTVNLAINYGGRDEIFRATQRMQAAIAGGTRLSDTGDLQSFLDQPDLPDPDLIIRTGGDKRMSNFLLWQSAYAELYFTNILWPDWDEQALHAALLDFAGRQRRFGGSC